MGLDITLIRIVNNRTDDLSFLPESDYPELGILFGPMKKSEKIDYGEGEEIVTTYYYEEISYQRKGVKKEFYTRYRPSELILTKSALNELATFIDKDHFLSFRTDFIEKFVEGNTVILISS